MNIAIYGDSFGCMNLDLLNPNQISWPKLLIEAGHEVANHSRVGATYSYTFRKFHRFRESYDINIVLITKPGRLELHHSAFDRPFFTCKDEAELFRKNELKNVPLTDRPKVESLLDYVDTYFDNMIDRENELMARAALTSEARRLPGSNIFIGCFDNVIPESPPLYDIYNFENISLDYDLAFPSRGTNLSKIIDGKFLNDTRVCHLAEENHRLIAEKILNAIKTKSQTIDLKVNEFRKPSKDIMHYFKWVNA